MPGHEHTRALGQVKMIAHQVFLDLGLDIHQRITEGRVLALGEVEMLARTAGLRQDQLEAMSQMDESSREVATRVLTPERSRMRPTGKGPGAGRASIEGNSYGITSATASRGW